MKAAFTRAAALLALPFLAAACEDGAGPEGDVSSFVVQAYVEVNDTFGMGASDVPVSVNVTVTSMTTDLVLTDATDADGVVTFTDLPAGAYVVSHTVVDAPAGAELQGSATQTVVAPFLGGEVITRFVYAFQPGTLAGVLFRDENGSGAFESDADSVFRDVTVLIFEGADADTAGAPIATDETDDEGGFDLGELDAGDYTLLVRAPDGTALVGVNPRTVTIGAGAPTFLALELIGDATGPVITIAEARTRTLDDTVKVRGVVTAAQGTFYDEGLYLQDATGGVFVYGLNPDLGYAVGDSLQVIGRVWDFREEVFVVAIAVVPFGTGTTPDPVTVTATDLNAGLAQGRLGTLTATVDSITAGDGGFDVWVEDADSVDALVFVDNDTGIGQAAFTVGASYVITGVLGTFDADDDDTIDAFDYRLQPRSIADIDEP